MVQHIVKRAHVALVAAAAFLAGGCPRAPAGARDAGSDAPSTPADAASEAATDAGDAATDAAPPAPYSFGWGHPARHLVFPDQAHTSREEFLRAHGVASAKPDASCWSQGLDLCSCDRAFVIDTATGSADVLVCDLHVEAPRAALPLAWGRRSVLYAVEKGTMKLLLDVPTSATVDPEDRTAGMKVGKVELRAVPSPGGVTFVDQWENDAGPWCPQAVAHAAAQRGQDWPLVKRWYAAACATAGRYILKNGRLVKAG